MDNTVLCKGVQVQLSTFAWDYFSWSKFNQHCTVYV